MKNKLITILLFIIILFALTGCDNSEDKNISKNGYYTYVTTIINGKPLITPVWHEMEVEDE